ncbi:MAG: hypothetical protein NZM25_08590 [Leptospiraceae bacterium]|nr:hypothetical protein [Leptospiraceae bacterium]MDW8306774.1 hypothetical protein [Leptospiraceae bacterium]
MKKSYLIFLVITTVILLGYLWLGEKKYESGELRPVFGSKKKPIVRIQYELLEERRGKLEPITSYLLVRHLPQGSRKEYYEAQLTEAMEKDPSVVRTFSFLLLPMTSVYFSDMENLSSFEESGDEPNLHKSLGFSPCRERVTFWHKDSDLGESFCLGEKTYNEARRYVLWEGKKILLTYQHIWQRYRNSVYSLAEMLFIPNHWLYNNLELSLSSAKIKARYPKLWQYTQGKLLLVPKKVKSQGQEQIVWHFSPEGILSESFATRIQATASSLRYRVLLRIPEKLPKLEPYLSFRLYQKDIAEREREVAQLTFYQDLPQNARFQSLSGEKFKTVAGDILVISPITAGILGKEEAERLFSIFKEMEEALTPQGQKK